MKQLAVLRNVARVNGKEGSVKLTANDLLRRESWHGRPGFLLSFGISRLLKYFISWQITDSRLGVALIGLAFPL